MVDLIVDVLDPAEHTLGFFFVQVKSTSVSKSESSTLKIDMDHAKFVRMASLPVPTFLIGVDTVTENAFVVAPSTATRSPFSSITKRHDLQSDSVRICIYKEVTDFWHNNRSVLKRFKSQFGNER